jgi:calmodulin
MNEFDISSNGVLDFDEFVTLLHRVKTPESEEELLESFRVFDRDGSGVLTAGELRFLMSNLGEKLSEEEVDEMLRHADVNGDGQINYEGCFSFKLSEMKFKVFQLAFLFYFRVCSDDEQMMRNVKSDAVEQSFKMNEKT